MDQNLNILVNYFKATKQVFGSRLLKHDTDFFYPENFKLLQTNKINIEFNTSKRSFLHALSFHTLKKASAKIKLNLYHYDSLNKQCATVYLPEKLLDGKSLFFSHGLFPVGIREKGLPVLTNTGFMTNKYENIYREEDRWKEVKQISKLSAQSTFITFSTNNAIERFCSFAPKMRSKIKLAPFLIPKINSITEEEMYRKHFGKVIKICFVGLDGKRKGLLNLLSSINQMHQYDTSFFSACEFVFVTNTSVTLPDGIRYQHYKSLPNTSVMQVMRESAIFCMPTLKDAYGIVYLEAMGNGCAVLCDDEIPRQELFKNNLARFTNPNALDQIEAGLRKLINDTNYRFELATKALIHFNQNYSFEVVSQYYQDLFQETINVEKFSFEKAP